MSNPTEPTPPPSDGSSPDAQPTEAYPPADAQPTEVYPPADAQPTEAYPPAPQPAYGQPAYGQPGYDQPANTPAAAAPPAYGAPAYGDPALAPAPTADRPRTLGWISLGLALGGLVLVGAAFAPLLWVSLILACIGGLLLLVALVLGIVTLANKKQGGKGLGIAAIAVSVLGGLAWIGAITLAFVWIGVAAVNSSADEPNPGVSVEATPDDEGTDEGSEEATGTYDEAAYVAQVRPEIAAIMQEIDPSITEDVLTQIYSDEVLVSMGQGLLVGGDALKETFVSSITSGTEGLLSEEQAIRFYDAVYGAAQQHLVE